MFHNSIHKLWTLGPDEEKTECCDLMHFFILSAPEPLFIFFNMAEWIFNLPSTELCFMIHHSVSMD